MDKHRRPRAMLRDAAGELVMCVKVWCEAKTNKGRRSASQTRWYNQVKRLTHLEQGRMRRSKNEDNLRCTLMVVRRPRNARLGKGNVSCLDGDERIHAEQQSYRLGQGGFNKKQVHPKTNYFPFFFESFLSTLFVCLWRAVSMTRDICHRYIHFHTKFALNDSSLHLHTLSLSLSTFGTPPPTHPKAWPPQPLPSPSTPDFLDKCP
jgi:hypothetical protein